MHPPPFPLIPVLAIVGVGGAATGLGFGLGSAARSSLATLALLGGAAYLATRRR